MFTVTRRNERIIGQIGWNNRENNVEIWNRIIGKFFGTIGSALFCSLKEIIIVKQLVKLKVKEGTFQLLVAYFSHAGFPFHILKQVTLQMTGSMSFIGFSVGSCINEEEHYLLPS